VSQAPSDSEGIIAMLAMPSVAGTTREWKQFPSDGGDGPSSSSSRRPTRSGLQAGQAFPKWNPPRPSAAADVHPSGGGDFPQEPPMPAALAFIVIPAKAGIQARPTRLAQQDNENQHYEVGPARRAGRLDSAKLA